MKEKLRKIEETSLKPITWIIILSVSLILLTLILSFAIYNSLSGSSSNKKSLNEIIDDLKTHEVEINKIGFIPPILNINVGEKVIWTNSEHYYFHKVISINDTEINSDKLLYQQNYTHVFLKEGTFEYNCPYHPYTKGKIIVK